MAEKQTLDEVPDIDVEAFDEVPDGAVFDTAIDVDVENFEEVPEGAVFDPPSLVSERSEQLIQGLGPGDAFLRGANVSIAQGLGGFQDILNMPTNEVRRRLGIEPIEPFLGGDFIQRSMAAIGIAADPDDPDPETFPAKAGQFTGMGVLGLLPSGAAGRLAVVWLRRARLLRVASSNRSAKRRLSGRGGLRRRRLLLPTWPLSGATLHRNCFRIPRRPKPLARLLADSRSLAVSLPVRPQYKRSILRQKLCPLSSSSTGNPSCQS